MSIIQNIRDKAAWIIIGAIALALIAFIVQDAFQNQSLFSNNPTNLGTVAGKKIDAAAFEERFKRAEAQYQSQGYPMNEMMRQNIREAIWNEYVEEAIMSKRYQKLGIQTSDRELSDILYGANPPEDLRRQFSNPNTGQYDANAANQAIQELKKQKNNPQYAPQYQSFYFQYLPELRKNRQREKYLALLANSYYVPRWMVEKTNTDNSQRSSISFVNVPYSSIPDSAVKVSDEEIVSYVNKHKEEYKQERTRGIEYVAFNAAPSKADSLDIYNQVVALKDEFTTTDDPAAFLVRNGSEVPFFDGYVLKSKMQVSITDTIQSLQEGQVYGPYLDAGNYTLARMIDIRNLPDSVFARHILIRTGGENATPDSIAKKRIDSIEAAIKGGADFVTLMNQLSDDKEANKLEGGVMKMNSVQIQNKDGFDQDFARFIFFEGKKGDRKVVKTQFGYHYIDIVDQKNFEPGYKVAYFSKAIVASDATDVAAMGMASQFAAESRTRKKFEENAKKNNYNRFTATDIKPLESNIQGVGESREVVRWMYEAEPGDVADRPFRVGDKYIVPVLIHAFEEGTMGAPKARPMVEFIIRNEKKASQIVSKIGSANSLDAVSKAVNQPISQTDSVLFSSPYIPNVGQEMKLVGASFNKQNQTKISEPILGNGGLFVLKINSISAMANPDFDAAQQQASMQQMQQRNFSNPQAILEILKKTVKIKDNRAEFF
jgi:peptidyl-prolyl cis-trans isomerase D